MRRVRILPVLTGVFLIVSGLLTIAQEQKPTILLKKIHDFHVADAPPSLVLERLSAQYSVPIGVESVPDSVGGKTRIAVDVQDGTVMDVLNGIASRDPTYRWQEIDGVVDVFPKTSVDSLLETVIGNYEVRNVNKEDAIKILKDSAEVKRQLSKTGARERTFLTPTWTPLDKLPRFTLVLKKATVRTILNEILKASGSNYWAFFRYGVKNEYLSLSVQ